MTNRMVSLLFLTRHIFGYLLIIGICYREYSNANLQFCKFYFRFEI